MPFLSVAFSQPGVSLGGFPGLDRGFTATEARALAGAFPGSVGFALPTGAFDFEAPLVRMCASYLNGNPEGLPGVFDVGSIRLDRGELCSGLLKRPEIRERYMGFLDTITGAITGFGQAVGTAIGTAGAVIGQVAPVIVGGIQAVQGVQAVLNGGPAPMGMMAGAMAAGGGAATQGSDAQRAFQMACEMDPMCKAAVVAALQGGTAGMMPGMMMNGVTDVSDAQLAALGLPPAFVMALRTGGQGALNALRTLLPGLATGAAIGVGGALASEGVSALVAPGTGTRLPRRINVPDGRGGVREYVSRGRPILYSGDIAAVKRVRRAAARAGRARPRRRSYATQILALPGNHANVCGSCLTAPCECKRG